MDPQHKWRLHSAGYLLVSLVLFGLTILAVRRHTAWSPWAFFAVVFFVLGARKQPPATPGPQIPPK